MDNVYKSVNNLQFQGFLESAACEFNFERTNQQVLWIMWISSKNTAKSKHLDVEKLLLCNSSVCLYTD